MAAEFDRLTAGDDRLVTVNRLDIDGAADDASVDERGARCAGLAAAVVRDVVPSSIVTVP
ncbi:MAG: hypothetical protein ABI364_04855 [Caldimonas sp.]